MTKSRKEYIEALKVYIQNLDIAEQVIPPGVGKDIEMLERIDNMIHELKEFHCDIFASKC